MMEEAVLRCLRCGRVPAEDMEPLQPEAPRARGAEDHVYDPPRPQLGAPVDGRRVEDLGDED